MKNIFYAVFDKNGQIISFDQGERGTVKGIFDNKNDAVRFALKHRADGFYVKTVGIMTVVDK